MSFIEYMVSDIKNERKFRRELRRLLEADGLESRFAHLLSPDVSVAKCRRELNAFSKQAQALEDARIGEATRTAERIGLNKDELNDLLRQNYFAFLPAGDHVEMPLDSPIAVERKLILHGAECKESFRCSKHIELSETADGFLLELLDPEDCVLTIPFQAAEMSVNPLHAMSMIDHMIFGDAIASPWTFLSTYADGIRAHIDENCANAQELKLRPLIHYLTDEEKTKPPKLLAEVAERHGATEVLKKHAPKRVKLFRELSKQKYEPMWRELFGMLEESQKGYSTAAELSVGETDAVAHRALMTEQMRAHGFLGEYPHFYKEGAFRRPRLLRAFGEVFVVGFEKYAVHHVLCRMINVGERGNVGAFYLCGAVFRKRAEEETDIYSCLFDRHGKACISYVSTALLAEDEDAAWRENCRHAASAAAKSALLLPLTRQERDCKHVTRESRWLLLGMFLFMSIFFGVGMTLGMMLIDFLTVMIVTGSFAMFAEQFFEVPWWQIGVFAGGVFGGAMTLLELLQRRK